MHSSNLTDVTVEFTSSADDNEDIPDSLISFLTKAMNEMIIICSFDKRYSQIK